MQEKIEIVRRLVKEILNPNEHLLTLYSAGKSQSIYVCVLSDTFYYKVFRISDHRSYKTYRQPTFYLEEGDFTLRGQIREFLYEDGSWYKLTQLDANLLRLFEGAQEHHSSFYRGGRYHDKARRIYFHKRNEHYQYVHYLFDGQFSHAVDKLIFSGLFNTFRTPFGLRIYPTQFVEAYLEILPRNYLPTSENQRVNWDNLDDFITLIPSQPHQSKQESFVELSEVSYTISRSADLEKEKDAESIESLGEASTVQDENSNTGLSSEQDNRPFRIFWKDIKLAFVKLFKNLTTKSTLQPTDSAIQIEQPNAVQDDSVSVFDVVSQPVSPVQERKEPKRITPDPIKGRWQKNIENRHTDKMFRLLDGKSFDKLQAFKDELPKS